MKDECFEENPITCPKCGTNITFASAGNLKYAREVFGYTRGDGMFAIDNKPHKCKILKHYGDGKK